MRDRSRPQKPHSRDLTKQQQARVYREGLQGYVINSIGRMKRIQDEPFGICIPEGAIIPFEDRQNAK